MRIKKESHKNELLASKLNLMTSILNLIILTIIVKMT